MTTLVRPRGRGLMTRGASRPPALRRLALPVGAFVASRVLVLAAIAAGNHLRGARDLVRDSLHLWDGNWYLSAAAGYVYPQLPPGADVGQVNIAFFPAYPLLIRWASGATEVTPLAAAIALTWVFGALAVVAVWLLVRRVADDEVADRAALLLAFFPGTVVFSMVYSESVMLAAAAGCLLALLSQRWLAAGLLGALASAARPNGLVLAACCAWAALAVFRSQRDWRVFVAPALAPLGAVTWLGWLWWRTGEPLMWLRVQRQGWGEGVDFGRSTMRDIVTVSRLADDLNLADLPMATLLRVAGLVVVAVALLALARWRPPAVLVVYTAGVLALSLLSVTLGARPRFVTTAFPLVAALAWALRGRAFEVALALSAGLSCVAAVIYTTPGVVAP